MKTNMIIIETVGNLFLNYRSDLEYIRSFQNCKLHRGDHLKHFRDTVLPRFLVEYRIVRGLKKGKQKAFLKTVMAHVKTAHASDVDCLAKKLRESGITQNNKTMISLASKILFLNNPWEILPYDRLVRIAIGYSGHTYSGYFEAVQKSRGLILKRYHALPNSIRAYLRLIEGEIAPDIPCLDRIRKARFIDKVLWTLGRKKMDLSYIDR